MSANSLPPPPCPSTTPHASQDGVTWEGPGPHLHLTSSPDALMAALRAVQPQAPGRQGQGQGASAPCRPLDLGQLVGLLGPLAVAEAADGARVRVTWGLWVARGNEYGVAGGRCCGRWRWRRRRKGHG